MFTIYIGYDPREEEATQKLVNSINKLSSKPINIKLLKLDVLRRIGLYRRAPDMKSTCWGDSKNMIDCFDQKPFSTEFSFSRLSESLII